MRDIGWVAGIFEGEGSVSASTARRTDGRSRRSPQLKFSIGMTDFDVLEEVHRIVGMGTLCGPYSRPNKKDHWVWSIQKQADAIAFAELIRPYLFSRRREQLDAAVNKRLAYVTSDQYHSKQGVAQCA